MNLKTERSEPASASVAGWASDVAAQTIRELGYRYIAMVPGSSFRGLQDSIVNLLGNASPEIVMALHEAQSVFIAQGYARATDEPMGVALHANVGLLNGAMGIFDTWCDRQPMLVIGATGPVDADKRRPWIDWVHTARDQGALVRNFVKWDDQPNSTEATVESLLRAHQIANTEPSGPVYVCLDAGIQESRLSHPVAIPPVERFAPPPPPAAGPASISALVEALRAAKRPLLLFGRGRRSLEAWNKRVVLAEACGATVLSGTHAAAVFPTTHIQHVLPPVGERPTSLERDLVAAADLIVSFDWHDLAGFLRARTGAAQTQQPLDARIASVSLEPVLANGWNMDHQALPAVDIPVLADPDTVVGQLVIALGGEKMPSRLIEAEHWTAHADCERAKARGSELTVQDLAWVVTGALQGEPVTYARLPFGWPTIACVFEHPLAFLGKDAGGTVGSGPGHTVGSALALKGSGRLVVGIIGDGDFAIGMQALWSASYTDTPALFIVANNRSYFNDEVHQERVARERDRPVENKWIGQRIEPFVDNAAIARAQGFAALGPLEGEQAVRDALEEAVRVVQSGGRVLLDVVVKGGYGE
ncbi:thiamine pyrophosphate-binding protein [Chelativorans salis]|uniref:Thiamine pyrophosphate-binding protein n=1 Tax=Chelativorans salis TaxID=2978478 RepID=A0ABT2LXM9_9HYPH|nr:thiamine pyrophosphate-binding protein [Chelativorans sp. EGI FJ00035]MCT7378138.1 thiamine pyrophosphate-binding protein [Chelativorans sp. EGI FJ00035]